MKKTLQYLLIILVICLSSGKELFPDEISIQLRLYEGFREMDFPSSRVISSYHLDRTPQNLNFSNISVSRERDALKRVFNLKDVKLITYGNLLVEGKTKGISSQLFVLNQKSIIIRLILLSRQKNRFNLNVIEARKKQRLCWKAKSSFPRAKPLSSVSRIRKKTYTSFPFPEPVPVEPEKSSRPSQKHIRGRSW